MADRRSSMMEKAEATEKIQPGSNTTDVDGPPQDPVAQQHELLVSEIESTDGHLGTALRRDYYYEAVLSVKAHRLYVYIAPFVS